MYKASCWDCDDFYMGKTKRRLHDRKTEHVKALSKSCQTSAIADHITSTGHNTKWDYFKILATGRSDIHCRIKEYLLIKDLAKLQNTLPFICISLNKNSIFNNYSTSARWVWDDG